MQVLRAILAIIGLLEVVMAFVYHAMGNNGDACFFLLLAVLLFLMLGDE